MKLSSNFQQIATLLVLFTVSLLIYEGLFGPFDSSKNLSIYFIILITALVTLFSAYLVNTLSRNPSTLTISILGFPSTGKTVFLTVLFDELQRYDDQKVRFTPYGLETVEAVTRSLNKLSKGEWLPPTSESELFYYRANAMIGTSLFPKRFKIEIADYAGERIKELNPSDERWLHKTDYFKYVSQSDAIIFAIDSEAIASADSPRIEEIQNSFIAALHLLIENKGVAAERRLKAPLAIIFTKVDLLQNHNNQFDFLDFNMSRLLSVCEKRCHYYKTFYISSVGHVTKNGMPPPHLTPLNVTKPLIWLLNKAE